MLTVLTEMMEQGFAEQHMKVEAAELDSYQRAVNCLRRVLETVGLQRRPRDVTDLQTYLASKYGGEDTDAAAE